MYISGAVVKIASRCNLNCKYCYVYNKGDDSYLKQAKFMTKSTIDEFAIKLKQYLKKYNKTEFIIVFHGGEPMLAGKERLKYFIETISRINEGVHLFYGIQTNATLITKEWIDFFNKYKINVGISVDGTKESNDFYRVKKNGKTSYSEIKRGIDYMREFDKNGFGVLTVIDINQNPIEVYNHYKTLNIRNANLLFPDDNYDDEYNDDEYKMGVWLSKIYDLWDEDPSEDSVDIKQFNYITSLMLGYHLDSEYYGLGRPNTFILETNGELQANDPLRVSKNGMSKTSLNISKNAIDDLYELPLSFLYYNNHKLLNSKCKKCPILNICGGGYIINRYSKNNGFDNPTIYCKSYAYFITHVQNKIFDNIKKESLRELEPLKFEDVLSYIKKREYSTNPFLESFK